MALIGCRQCGRQISDKAATCPSCHFPASPATGSSVVVTQRPTLPPNPHPEKERWKAITTGLIIVVGIGFFVMHGSGPSGKQGSSNPDTSQVPESKPLPSISVVDADSKMPDTSLSFRDWQNTGLALSATMTWNGSMAIDTIGYTVKQNGVVKQRSNVEVPGGGMKKDEPIAVRVWIGDSPTSDMQVTIEVLH